MKMEIPVKLELDAHVKLETPIGDCHANLEIRDVDDDGKTDVRLKWNLPGKMLDSGPEGLKATIDANSIVRPFIGVVAFAAKAVGAPDMVVDVLESFAR